MSILMKCKKCKEEFIQYNSLQRLCVPCAILNAKLSVKKERTVKDKATKKETKNKLKTSTQKVNEVKKIFQKWIRVRDEELSCISCGATFSNPFWDGGHYKKAELYKGVIFNEINCNKQCRKCNFYLDGNESNYRQGLVIKYGLETVLELEELAQETRLKKWSDEELKEISEKYSKKLAQMKLIS